jgi:hypothetical protein
MCSWHKNKEEQLPKKDAAMANGTRITKKLPIRMRGENV